MISERDIGFERGIEGCRRSRLAVITRFVVEIFREILPFATEIIKIVLNMSTKEDAISERLTKTL